MIVPMKKVSIMVLDTEKEKALKKLRKLGLVHIEMTAGTSGRLSELREQAAKIEQGIYAISDKADKNAENKKITREEALCIAEKIISYKEEKKTCIAKLGEYKSELERFEAWGEIDLFEIDTLAKKGISLSMYEMPAAEYEKLDDKIKTLALSKTKKAVRFAAVNSEDNDLEAYKVNLPSLSTADIKKEIKSQNQRLLEIDAKLLSYTCYIEGMKEAVSKLQKEIEFEGYCTGMQKEELSKEKKIAYFSGYIPSEDIESLKKEAKKSAWGLLTEDPGADDDVPTKLKNNKLVSLIYPLTDFLGTVPGYFEYDISSWFLGFILIFFGIIFGDGGYGILICGAALALMLNAKRSRKPIAPAYVLVALLGGATVLWGLLTCTWFGLSPEQIPEWLKGLSLPIISNVYADKIWYPFWTEGKTGLTTAQNLQIVCFSLALVQLTAAHVMEMIRNRSSLKMLGDIGSILQLVGIFYVVLSLVVNGEVFAFGLVIGGIPVGTVAIALVGIGFLMSFVFANYEGSLKDSVLSSLTNIVSVLLGVVNVFSDIVSYIRLWAVGMAGAAISATVNELAGPLLGNFMFMILAIVLLVFGHGLNMILNILSVIVHGVRLNTLEFSTHLNMSWSGHKYDPFKE